MRRLGGGPYLQPASWASFRVLAATLSAFSKRRDAEL